ncbi:MAG: SDR family oxidoreductase [Chloroflexi bacterium]|nr:SDR family oxidoreductase [Chloroflexota bacterium]
MLKEFNLEGRVAIVTGSGRGLGKGIALALAEAGADVVTVSRTAGEIEKTSQEVRQLGRKSLPVVTDLLNEDQVAGMVEKAVAEFGKIDILVNNAGRSSPKPLLPLGQKTVYSDMVPNFDTILTRAEFQEQIDANLVTTFLVTRAVGPHLIKQRKGKVINITSNQSTKAMIFHIAYGSAKAALNMFTKSLALEWARYNINVNAIGSGLAYTDLGKMYIDNEKLKEPTMRMIPLRRLTEPRDIGLLAVYLASDASNNMTGQVIYCDGGQVIA